MARDTSIDCSAAATSRVRALRSDMLRGDTAARSSGAGAKEPKRPKLSTSKPPAARRAHFAPQAVKAESACAAKQEGQELYPLTPGLYEFRGFTTSALPLRRRRRSTHSPPTKDECFVTLRLLPGGALEGTSREISRPQLCPVRGTWRADRVRYVLAYKVRDAVGQFQYAGRIEGAHKILGRWANVDDAGLQEGYSGGKGELELELTQAVRLSSAKASTRDGDSSDVIMRAVACHKIRVLTTGAYSLKGCATDDDGYEYACELRVQLLGGGALRGTMRERVFDQTQRITGTWTPHSIAYTQRYAVEGDVGEYVYTGRIECDGEILAGDWANANEQDKETCGERGTFAYGVVHAQRQWSCYSHAHYPQSFRDAVQLVLLCSSRTHTLPTALWCCVFALCHESWFA